MTTPENVLHTAESPAETHGHDDRFTFLGRTFNVPVYTGVFFVLGVLTLIEVTLSQLPRPELSNWLDFVGIVMVAIAFCKAGLVVWFYMHLNKDTRIFLACMLVPLFLVIVSALFLIFVPQGSY
jgi:caa(3)-type oxidase subunit IV